MAVDRDRFDQLLQVRASSSLSLALSKAADNRRTSVSNYVRQAVIDRMRAEGIDVTPAVA